MVMDVVPDSQTLHISKLRKRWQILFLQLLATGSLLTIMRRMSDLYGSCSDTFVADAGGTNYWCPSYEHTRGLQWMSRNSDLVIPDYLSGVNETGFDTFIAPLILCFVLTIAFVILMSRSDKFQKNLKRGLSLAVIAWIALPFLLSWFIGIVTYGGLYLPIGNEDPNMDHVLLIFQPLKFIFELVFLGIVFAPVLAGLMGIWGLSKRMLTWAAGYFLMIIGIHAMLTFEGVTQAVDVGLKPLPAQIGEATLFGGLISPLAFELLSIALLLLVFLEAGLAVITNLEYASLLPEGSKKDPEYVNQFNNVLNGHLWHLIGIMALVGLTTAMALEFDDFLIGFVGALEGSQWSGQVRESLELQLTYGKVISAGLFMVVIAGGRFVIPWQRVTGFVETNIRKLTSREV
ncbi:MAG: hypothetical protein HN534_01135 [Euryarchaeota archaeon]|jgi:hypothetical protein|nr:hypothetical protein [Euryarchaeota archaeon]MBT3653525.1 hypothetical protein [Euryarchaeota archaeon]MBT3757629.1 hypothetical protein [Euryarchaeota archaeon]MBT4050909.1 hypothetical protein [Euryarchaeota archaeon]MBT4346509.1 hypothetical protein [Euryarchaeota archaeon]